MILVTGANGFVGNELIRCLQEAGRSVCAAVRSHVPLDTPGLTTTVVGSIGSKTDWQPSLKDVDTVIHLASRVHVMRETSLDPLAEFREVNVEGTKNLALQASQAGVKRFIYVSTVKVNGEISGDDPFRESDPPCPTDHYAVSKWEAEQALWSVSQISGIEVVVIRPPLVYGPGVRANFLRLMHWVDRGYPLPFGAVRNRRSLLYLGNLVDGLIHCVDNPSAANQTFLLSDAETLSTPELIRELACALGRRANLVNIPVGMLRIAGRVTRRSKVISRLVDSLWVDSSNIVNRLGWRPPFTVEQGLAETAMWYRNTVVSP